MTTSKRVAHVAGRVLGTKKSSKTAKELAAADLAQAKRHKKK
jgi:hypothetical protein